MKPRRIDSIINLTCVLGGLYLYINTLAPTVLEGDAALFQFTPYVLGVTYPTGFPLYLLLGKLWVTLIPFGEIAWRMNLFSAVCGALALPFIYSAVWRLLAENEKQPYQQTTKSSGIPAIFVNHTLHAFLWPRLAALTTVLTFSTLPTYWRWATSAKTYTLNILLLSIILYLLAKSKLQPSNYNIFLISLLLGLSISVHNTMIFLIPGVALFIFLQLRQQITLKQVVISCLLLLISLSFYLYIPLRAEWLIAQYGREAAIQSGLLADFYNSGITGLQTYFSAKEFMQGVTADWGEVPGRFYPVYVTNLLHDEVGWLGITVGLIGSLLMLLNHPRLFASLLLIYAIPIPFVLAYGRGQQSAFLLPSFLMFCIFIGHSLQGGAFVNKWISVWMPRQSKFGASLIPPILSLATYLLFLFLIPFYLMPRVQYGFNWLENKWTDDIRAEWEDAMNHPLEPSAGLLAEWADLTPFWYLQHAEKHRSDLRGIYPPTEETTLNYLQSAGALYIAGLVDVNRPERQWMIGLDERYQLIPWGRLVRIAPLEADPVSLLPHLTTPIEATFANQLHLFAAEFPPQAIGGQSYPINLIWQTLAELPPETTVSIRLTQGDSIVAQLDDTLLSGWFPKPQLPAQQYLLSHMPIPIPLGTLPGQYRLQMVVYAHHSQPWPMTDGSVVLDLGPVDLLSPPQPISTLASQDFNGEIELTNYTYSVSRVGQGKGFAVTMLWQARHQPTDNYKLRVALVSQTGELLRSLEHFPPLPTAQWQAGQMVRDLVNLVLPASAPIGDEAIYVQLSWLRPDGSRLNARQWGLPLGDTLDLQPIRVTEKKNRIFTAPPITHSLEVGFEDKLRLLGWNFNDSETCHSDGLQSLRLICNADGLQTIDLTLIWQGQQEMAELYTVFLHLVDENGQVIRQMDKVPGIRGKQPTTGWLPTEIILDPISVAADVPPGRYTLRAGMYLPPNGPRLLVINDAGEATGDFVELGEVIISLE